MALTGEMSNEDAAQFRTSEVVENVVPAHEVIEVSMKRIMTYRADLQKQIDDMTKRLGYLQGQQSMLDEWLRGDVLHQVEQERAANRDAELSQGKMSSTRAHWDS